MLSAAGQLGPSALVVVLCAASGAADAQGFLHASRIWEAERLIWPEVARSALGFSVGICCFWASLPFMQRLGIVAPEVQTTVWFFVTIVGVALASGRVARWPVAEQAVAVAITLALGWLLVRSSAAA
jgi:hypothetical protein